MSRTAHLPEQMSVHADLKSRVPGLLALIMTVQRRRAQRVVALYDRSNGRGEFLTAHATLFDTLEINGYAGEDAGGTAVFGLTLGMYVWAFQISCAMRSIRLAGNGTLSGDCFQPLRVGTYFAAPTVVQADLVLLLDRLRKSPDRKEALALFLELTWAVWNHEIAHVVSGHARAVCEDGVSRFLREIGDAENLAGLLAVGDLKIMEGEADCRAASMRTAEILDRADDDEDAVTDITRELAAFLFSCAALFALLFASRRGELVNEAAYPSPLSRLTYSWTMVKLTLQMNDIAPEIAEAALQQAFHDFDAVEAVTPEASLIREIIGEELQRGLKQELWDIGSQSIARHSHFASYEFGSSKVEVVVNPFT